MCHIGLLRSQFLDVLGCGMKCDKTWPSLVSGRNVAMLHPVSYTHLDVYKRQAQMFVTFWPSH